MRTDQSEYRMCTESTYYLHERSSAEQRAPRLARQSFRAASAFLSQSIGNGLQPHHRCQHRLMAPYANGGDSQMKPGLLFFNCPTADPQTRQPAEPRKATSHDS